MATNRSSKAGAILSYDTGRALMSHPSDRPDIRKLYVAWGHLRAVHEGTKPII